jgi:hypothetical protein
MRCEWPREQFRKHGVNYEPSDKTKNELFLDLLPYVNSPRSIFSTTTSCSIKLVALERRTSRGGKDSIDHPPGGHDDLANAVAGALILALAKKSPMRATKGATGSSAGRGRTSATQTLSEKTPWELAVTTKFQSCAASPTTLMR